MIAVTDLTAIDAERTIVTSALPYIHGVPHLGNLVGSILPADLYHRYLDVRGHENIFICGSDEHGTPLELSAIEAGEPPAAHADRQHEQVKDVLDRFDMDFSLYGRTHTDYNLDQTHDMFVKLYENGYIVEKEQELPYCRVDERFLPDRYIEGECPHCGGLARGDQCDECGNLLEPEEIIDPYCTICGESDITFKTTKNLFLQLPKFADDLADWLREERPLPEHKMDEVLNLLDDGLEDRCITRDIDWGFPVPWEEIGLDEAYDDKVLYVWFDAPIGYIGITRQFLDQTGDEGRWRDYWQDQDARTIYSIGKDNTIFHAISFPATLMGSSDGDEVYNLPDHEFIHEYLLADDVQFSKSRGTGLSSEKALDLLPPDYWRFYLSSAIPEGHDTTFSWDDFASTINGELNDNIGNFVNRVLSLAEDWFDNTVPDPDDPTRYEETLDELADLIAEYDRQFEEAKSPRKAFKTAQEIARLGDQFIAREEPWHHEERQADVLYVCLQIVQAIALVFYPFIPGSMERLWTMLRPDEETLVTDRDQLAELVNQELYLEPGHQLGERELLFEKVDADDLAAAVDQETDDTDDEADTMTDTITLEQFQDLDLRTGTVKTVEDHPNADNLYLVQINVGGTTKQSCAGLKDYYTPDELEGKQVIVVNNLEPAELRGETSECMMLAVDNEDADQVILLQPEERVDNGLTVR